MSQKSSKRLKRESKPVSATHNLHAAAATSLDDSDNVQTYEYGIAELSDLTVVLQQHGVEHQHRLHKVKLAEQCNYFKTLVLNDKQLNKLILPDTYYWPAAQLQQFFNLMYGQHTTQIAELEQSKSLPRRLRCTYCTA